MKVTLHPGAEKDVQEAAAFYEREASAVLAARFIAEFKRVSMLLIEHPVSDRLDQEAGVASR